MAGVLLIGAALMYGYLSICYDRFYGSLGVDPNDVGLNYTGILARSSGFVVVYLLVAASIVPNLVSSITDWRERRRRGESIWRKRRPGESITDWRERRRHRESAVGFWILGAMMLGLLLFLPWAARYSAEIAMEGRAVAPIYPLTTSLPPILAIHADPATVEPAAKPEDAPAAERLQKNRELLYLGQANSTVVLYDWGADQAIYVPASSIILRVTNCDAKPLPDRCPRPPPA